MPNRVDKIFICVVCGNEVRVEKDGGGSLVCCGQDMKEKADDEE